ncbi:hypothetical protein RvY_07015 [Ramazzottius varieornatus]|uniref:Essential protein Yae1 N-terminal domain-containing protein n=1 Tax=Ramazzottius varieornatus TaxID=947166 RepID=A0A1D1V0X4_RAMVA|nr:hypothetical protein RvY_07015 [Ramazzottius varieornatus]
MEGFAFGWSKGWEIITEIGFYKGYAMRFRDRLIHPSSSIDDVPSEGTLRKQQAVSSFLDVISRISFDDIKNGAISDDILLARRKFKQVFPNVYSPRITVAEEISF